MDGGSIEKANLETWRQKVKEITNHKRKLRVRQNGNVTQSPQVDNTHENNHVSDSVEEAHLTPQRVPFSNEVSSTVLNGAHFPRWPPGPPKDSTRGDSSPALQLPIPSTTGLDQHETSQSPLLREKEAALLMHYLDYVFPLQFPFYKHSSNKGGRGWLLSLLMQLEPLYHAALSISAYHRHFELFSYDHELRFGSVENVRDLPACCILESQLTDLNITLNRLSDLLNGLGDLERSRSEVQLPRYIELIACMATLISLEVSHS